MQFFKWFKKGGVIEKSEEDKMFEDYLLRQQHQTKINELEKEMLSKRCALRQDFCSCTKACVHFRPGTIIITNTAYGNASAPVLPKCKLWK